MPVSEAIRSHYDMEQHMIKRVSAKHGIVHREEKSYLGYFGWPTVCRTPAGELIVAASGFRNSHICPWGKTTIFRSKDEGRTWSAPEIITDTPLDDRDAGIISLGGKKLLASWFISDIRVYTKMYKGSSVWMNTVALWNDDLAHWQGSYVRMSENGESWGEIYPSPVSAPHGPTLRADGTLLYFGKRFATVVKGKYQYDTNKYGKGNIEAWTSKDGKKWKQLGTVPLPKDWKHDNFNEPHALDLGGGHILGLIRYNDYSIKDAEGSVLTLLQTDSFDGGKTWSEAKPLGIHGAPPHLMRHSSGTIVCSYGYRKKPFGERAMISRDDGKTWETDIIINDRGPTGDLGYPSSVELADGSIFTAYYQQYRKDEPCSVLWSRWKLPR